MCHYKLSGNPLELDDLIHFLEKLTRLFSGGQAEKAQELLRLWNSSLCNRSWWMPWGCISGHGKRDGYNPRAMRDLDKLYDFYKEGGEGEETCKH